MICYDISDNKLRYRLVKFLEQYSVRFQYSVFKGRLTSQEIRIISKYAKKLLRDDLKGEFAIFKLNEEINIRTKEKSAPDKVLYI